MSVILVSAKKMATALRAPEEEWFRPKFSALGIFKNLAKRGISPIPFIPYPWY